MEDLGGGGVKGLGLCRGGGGLGCSGFKGGRVRGVS